MHDKQFKKEMLTESAHAYRAGRMDRRTFLALCGASGVAMNAVMAGDAKAAADHVVMWNWGGQSEECHGSAIGEAFTAKTGKVQSIKTYKIIIIWWLNVILSYNNYCWYCWYC